MPDDLFADLRRRLDVFDLAAEAGQKTGRGYFQCADPSCPSHKRKRLTAKCSDGQTFTCQACGAKGDAVDLIGMLWHLSPAEALLEAKRRAGLDGDEPPPPPPRRQPPDRIVIGEADLEQRLRALTIAEDHYNRLRREGTDYTDLLVPLMPRSDLDPTLRWLRVGHEYLNTARGIAPLMSLPVRVGIVPYWRTGLRERIYDEGGDDIVQAAFRCGLLRTMRKGGWWEYFKGRLFLPWHDAEGRCCNAKGRGIPDLANPCKLDVADDGKLAMPMLFLRTSDTDPERPPHVPRPPLPFGWGAALEMSAAQDGGRADVLPTVVHEGELDALSGMLSGVPSIATGGTSGAGVDALKGLAKKHGGDRFVVVFDGDTAGRRGAKRLAITLKARWNTLPDGTDCNDLLKTNGTGAVRAALTEAIHTSRRETPTARPEPEPPAPVGEVRPDGTQSLGLPPRWELKKGMLCRMVRNGDGDPEPRPTGIRNPPVICWRGRDVLDHSVVVAVSGSVVATGTKAEAAMPRSRIKTTRDIVPALADHGFDVDSTTARDMVQFLSDYEHAFGDRLPFKLGSKQMGWHGDSFLYGRDCYGDRALSYIGEETGILSALDCAGSADEWINGVLRPLERYPPAIFGLYAAMAAPVVRFVPDLTGFALEYAGASSAGKSTVAAAIASAFGDSRLDGGMMRPPYDTFASLELYAALLNNLPVFLEDAHLLFPKERARDLIMAWVNGAGKGRAERTGKARQEPRRWSTVAIITGEGSVVESTTYAGVGARVLALPPPLPRAEDGVPSDDLLADIRSMDRVRVRHYGHAGRMWVQWLVAGGLQRVLDSYDTWLPKVQEVARHDGPQQRWAKDLALIVAVASQAFQVIGGCERTSMILHEAITYLQGTDSPDQAEEALDLALAWFAMDHSGGIQGTHEVAKDGQHRVWFRVLDDGTVCLSVAELNERLARHSVSLKQVRKVWLDRGYLRYGGAPSPGEKVRLASGVTQCVTVAAFRAERSMLDREVAQQDSQQAVH